MVKLEAEIRLSIIRFKKNAWAVRRLCVLTYLLDDMALVRLQGVLNPAEQKLAQVKAQDRGGDLIKRVRLELLEHARPMLDEGIRDILGAGGVNLHTDISTQTVESVFLFTWDGRPQVLTDR